MQRKIRVLVGKPGLDGHDRGAKVVAAALRDAGMEVIYTGLHQSPEQIVEAAVQEDVDVVAVSILSGAHMTLFPRVLRLMRERGIGDKLLTGGGIIPPDDMEALQKTGIGRLFGPGSSTQEIAAYIRGWFVSRYGEGAVAPAPPPLAARKPTPAFTAEELAHHAAAGGVRRREQAPLPARAKPSVRARVKAKPAPRPKPTARPKPAARKKVVRRAKPRPGRSTRAAKAKPRSRASSRAARKR